MKYSPTRILDPLVKSRARYTDNRPMRYRNNARFFTWTALILLILLPVSCSQPEDIAELGRISRVMDRMDRVDRHIRSGSLTPADLAGLPATGLTPADPESVRYSLNLLCLEEFDKFIRHLEGSGLRTPDREHSRQYKRNYKNQQKLRMNLYRRFMKRLSRLEGEQLDALFVILASASPEARAQIYLLLNDMELAYYKNVEEINAPTRDEKLTFYSVKVDLGYDSGDKRMQTLLNENRKVLKDIVRNYFSGLTAEEMSVENEFLLKAGLLIRINKKLLSYDRKGNLYGVQDVAVLNLQSFQVP